MRSISVKTWSRVLLLSALVLGSAMGTFLCRRMNVSAAYRELRKIRTIKMPFIEYSTLL